MSIFSSDLRGFSGCLIKCYGFHPDICQEEGLRLLDEALALVAVRSERYYEAELHRLQGELLQRRKHA